MSLPIATGKRAVALAREKQIVIMTLHELNWERRAEIALIDIRTFPSLESWKIKFLNTQQSNATDLQVPMLDPELNAVWRSFFKEFSRTI